MSEDTIYWQNFYGGASERHAHLYHEKARQSYDFEKQEWMNLDDVLHEEENLSKAADYFHSHEKPGPAAEITEVIMQLSVYKAEAAAQAFDQAEEKITDLISKLRIDLQQGLDEAYRIAGRFGISHEKHAGISNLLVSDSKYPHKAGDSRALTTGILEEPTAGVTEDIGESQKEMPLSEDTAFWQSFYGGASERHAYLYYEKARQSYDLEKREWMNLDDVLDEEENLSKAADYFESHGKPALAQEILAVLSTLYAHKSTVLRQEVETRTQAIVRAVYGEVGITEDIDESRKGWTEQDRDLFLELERMLYRIKDPIELSLKVMYSPDQYSPPKGNRYRPDLINRRRERNNLLTALKQVNRISLHGPLGVGKTTLVAQLWHQEEVTSIFPDGRFWIRSPRTSLEEITDTMAIALREPALRVKPLTQQVAEVRRLLDGKRALIVLDEALSRDEVVTAMECTPPSCTLLVTGPRVRCLQSLNGELLTMESLEPRDAVALFHAWLGERTRYYDSQVEWEICRLLAYLPLAIELVSRYTAWSHAIPQQVLSRLQSFRRHFANTDNIALRTALAFCVDQLSDDSAHLLGTLCMTPANYVDLDVIEAVSDVDVQTCLPVLLDLGLVRFDRSFGYHPLPFLSDMVNIRSLQGSQVTDDDVWVRLLNFLQAYLATNAQNFGRLEQVHELLSWMIERHSEQEASAQIITSVRLMTPFLMTSGYWTDLTKALLSGIQSACLLDDRTALVNFRHQLALLCYHGDQDKLALKLFQENVDLLRDLKDWSTLSSALYVTGVLYEQEGDFQSAHVAYQQTLDISCQESAIYVHAAYRLGKLEFQRNDFQAARRAFQIAYNAVEQLPS